MRASKSSAASRSSKRSAKRETAAGTRLWQPALAAFLLSVAAIALVQWQGWALYFGDAQAHINIARRIVDSRTPGYEQIGTVWLPLPHVLMLPFVNVDAWWRNGLAGAIPSSLCFIAGCVFLFAALQRLFSSTAAWCGMLVLACNPNLLYLQAIPMTEALMFASACGVLCCSVAWKESGSAWWIVATAMMATVGVLTRYEAWFPLPFLALYFFLARQRADWRSAAIFSSIAAIAPLYWLAHNDILHGHWLAFYEGPGSAKDIYQQALRSGGFRYPGDHDLLLAARYFVEAIRLNAALPLALLGASGLLVAVLKKRWWPAALLSLPVLFYVISMYSSGTPVFVPTLWPSSWYNTRYGLAAFPLLALGCAALVHLVPARWQFAGAALLVGICLLPWLAYPRPQSWVTWKESEVNSVQRRAWTTAAAAWLREHPSPRIIASFGDVAGIFAPAGIPLRHVLHEGNGPAWLGASSRPDLLLFERTAVCQRGDSVAQLMRSPRLQKAGWRCVKLIEIKDSKVVEIWTRGPYAFLR
jgi:4-amino-4-deoxy-L-arabinose transferase-like glycosyltransferase